jgi:hypothetical protein
MVSAAKGWPLSILPRREAERGEERKMGGMGGNKFSFLPCVLYSSVRSTGSRHERSR